MWVLGLLACSVDRAPTAARCGDGDPELDLGDATGAFLYGDGVLDLGLDLDEAAIAALAETADEPRDDVHARLEALGAARDVGVHLRGHGTFEPIEAKPSFKVDIDAWDPASTLFGVHALTLNNLEGNDARLAEGVVLHLYEAAGVPAPRHGYACVAVNGVDYGVYGVIETPDEALVARLWGDDAGSLLEGTPEADLTPDEVDGFDVKVEGGAALDDVARLAGALASTSGDAWYAELDAWFDRDELLRMWAVELFSSSNDAYTTHDNNYLLHEARDGTWTMLPWGPDSAWKRDIDARTGGSSPHGALFDGCLAVPACAADLSDAIVDVAASTADDTETYAWREIARLGPLTRTDPRDGESPEEVRRAQQRMFALLEARPAEIAASLSNP